MVGESGHSPIPTSSPLPEYMEDHTLQALAGSWAV